MTVELLREMLSLVIIRHLGTDTIGLTAAHPTIQKVFHNRAMRNEWPALPLDGWFDTYQTLHMWTQVVGKVCLKLVPPVNHFWNIAFHIDARGLSTPLIPY